MSLIDDLPGVVEIDAEIAKLAELEQVYITGRAQEIASYTTAVAEHQANVDAALSSGQLPPDPPREPASEAVHMDRLVMFRNRASMLAERRLMAIAAGRDTIELKAAAAYADQIEKAKSPVGTLRQIAADIAAAQSARHEAACAVIAVDHERGQGASRPPSPGKIDAESVVATVQSGVDLFEQQTERHLGLQGSNLHEIRQPPPGSEPKPGGKPLRTSATVPPGYTYGH